MTGCRDQPINYTCMSLPQHAHSTHAKTCPELVPGQLFMHIVNDDMPQQSLTKRTY